MSLSRALFSSFLLLILFSGWMTAQEIVPLTVVLKLRQDSDMAMQWRESGRTGVFGLVKRGLPQHSIRPYISNATLQSVDNAYRQLGSLRRAELAIQNILVLTFVGPVDIWKLIRNLSDDPEIEFAEPAFRRSISSIPNDPYFSSLYYFEQCRILEAQERVASRPGFQVIAITDTGIDYNHEDLKENVWVRAGESGIDQLGRDKRSNGIDDDENGYIDDWRGWDFVAGPNGDSQDNDPRNGNEHGTHVAGTAGAVINNTIGIAGAGINVKIMPIKISPDEPSAEFISNGFEAILYAAGNGAGVVNCSWGGGGYSQAEQLVIDQAISLGAVVVAAAGNNRRHTPYYPASYRGVISVAAVDSNDVRAGFSNHDETVDVAAPGVDIYSCIPGSQYKVYRGTSMASPIVAALAAMLRMQEGSDSPEIIAARIQANADTIIDRNPGMEGLLGAGRVNFEAALQGRATKSARIDSYRFSSADSNDIFSPQEEVTLSELQIKNILAPLQNARVTFGIARGLASVFIPTEATIGQVASQSTMSVEQDIRFTIPDDVPTDYRMTILVNVWDGDTAVARLSIPLEVNPSYRTIATSRLRTTINSIGNIGYNDFPGNSQGVGFVTDTLPTLLFEGGLVVSGGFGRISSVVRSSEQSRKDQNFQPLKVVSLKIPGVLAAEEGESAYQDNLMADEAAVRIDQQTLAFDDSSMQRTLFLKYRVTNKRGARIDSLVLANFFDWDIGPYGANNVVRYDAAGGFGYVYNTRGLDLPLVSVALLTDQRFNFVPIYNPRNLYDGFSRMEKFEFLHSGVVNKAEGPGDVSMLAGADCAGLDPEESVDIAFAISVADSPAELADQVARSRVFARQNAIGDGFVIPRTTISADTLSVFPNPANSEVMIAYDSRDAGVLNLEVRDVLGRLMYRREGFSVIDGRVMQRLNLADYPQGLYWVRAIRGKRAIVRPFVVVR